LNATDFLLLDFKHVLSINESACHILHQLLCKLFALGKPMMFVHADRLPLLRRFMRLKLGARCEEMFRVFEDDDPALELCENLLLDRELPGRILNLGVSLASYELFENMSPAERGHLAPLLKKRLYQSGETIIQAGDEARELFFLSRGNASVYLILPSGRRKRLATFSAGMAFGEMAIIERAPRSALIVADTEVECDLLALDDFDRLSISCPEIKIKLLQNLGSGLSRKLRDAHRALRALS
jgi:glutaminase